MNYTNAVIFIILAFSLGLIMIMNKDSIPQKIRKGMALTAVALILFAFYIIVYSLYTMGSS
ncbi:hypothetical protein SAMN05661091_1553 [Paenibacillus uliginis N3/975]|uniref:Signal transduction histidine kinase n=1 Tax=Paenibacillus uliginis N3/975 TaxID=1313296 RepID=A0A1X7H2N3_9BACL|nr:hypothetical protein [Paenibacillus uliginis]SMF78375.1 hypothetical protein SAMN05661091_1553 [Paenibacillus uliginis N3/975]